MKYCNILTQIGPVEQSDLPTRDGAIFNLTWQDQMERGWRKLPTVTPVPEGYILIARTYTQSETSLEEAVDHINIKSVEESEAERQAAKPAGLKQFENLYVAFLTTIWTQACRSYNLIPQDYTITVTNTDSAVNIQYLLMIEQQNVNDYTRYSNKFKDFAYVIEARYQSTLADCVWHNDI